MKFIFTLAVYVLTFVNAIDSSAQHVPEHKAFFNYQSKVGLVLIVDSIQYIKGKHVPLGMGAFGVVPVTARVEKKLDGSKYDHALKTIAPLVDPTDSIKDLYVDIYSRKNKAISLLKYNIDSGATKYKGDKVEGRQYFKKDLRPLRGKLQIDEILVVYVQYGLMSEYVMGIETFRNCFATIETQLINLRNNQIIFKDHSGWAMGITKWDSPPKYDSLRSGVSKAIDKAIVKERKRYDF